MTFVNPIGSCGVVVPEEEVERCPPCIPDPEAVVPNWTEQDENEPFFNGRTCSYSAVVITDFIKFTSDQIPEILASAIPDGVTTLMEYYGKIKTPDVLITLTEVAAPVDYYVDTRELPIKVLISVPAAIFDQIPSQEEATESEIEEQEEEEEQQEEEGSSAGNVKTNFSGDNFITNFKMLINGLLALSYMFEADRLGIKLDDETPKSSIKAELKTFTFVKAYFDMKRYKRNIVSFITSNGYKIKELENIEITFSTDFKKIKKIVVKKPYCDPKELTKRKTKYLNAEEAKYDINNMLFSQMNEISEYFLSTRKIDWLFFMSTYLPFGISRSFLKKSDTFDFDKEKDKNCPKLDGMKDTLSQELNSLGRDASGALLSLKDSIVQNFADSLCKKLKEIQEEDRKEEDPSLRYDRLRDAKLRQLCAEDSLFSRLMFKIMNSTTNAAKKIADAPEKSTKKEREARKKERKERKKERKERKEAGVKKEKGETMEDACNSLDEETEIEDESEEADEKKSLKELLNATTVCVIGQLLTEALACALEGLGGKEASKILAKGALAKIIKPESVQEFMDSLPQEWLNEIKAAFNELGHSGFPWDPDFKTGFAPGEKEADAAAKEAGTDITPESPMTEEDIQRIIDGEQELGPGKLAISTEDGPVVVDLTHTGIVTGVADDGALGEFLDDIVDITVKYLIEQLETELDRVLDLIRKNWLGAQILAIVDFIKKFIKQCALPPVYDPPLKDVMKTLKWDPCGEKPRWKFKKRVKTKKRKIRPWDDLKEVVRETSEEAYEEAVFKAFQFLMNKVFSESLSLLCAAIASGTAALSEKAIKGGNGLLGLLGDSLCDTDEPEDVAAATNNMLAAYGAWDGSTKPSDKCIEDFIMSVSSVLTNTELMSLLNGTASENLVKVIMTLIKAQPPDCAGLGPSLSDIISSGPQVSAIFGAIGNIIPDDVINAALQTGVDNPVCPNICKDPTDLAEFNHIREALLTQRGLNPEQIANQTEKANERMRDTASSLLAAILAGSDLFGDIPYPTPYGCDASILDQAPDYISEDSVPEQDPSKESQKRFNKRLFGTATAALIGDIDEFFGFVMSDKEGNSFKEALGKIKFLAATATNADEAAKLPNIFPDYVDGVGAGGNRFIDSIPNIYATVNGGIDLDTSVANEDDPGYIYFKPQGNAAYELSIKSMRGNESVITSKGTFNNNISSSTFNSLKEDYSIPGSVNPKNMFSCKYGYALMSAFPGSNATQDSLVRGYLFNSYGELSSNTFMKNLFQIVTDQATLQRQFKLGYSSEPLTEDEKPGLKYYTPTEARVLAGRTPGSDDELPIYLNNVSNSYVGWYKNYLNFLPSPDMNRDATPLVNFDDMPDIIKDYKDIFQDDPRLEQEDPLCVLEPPYSLILSKGASASVEASIRATIRVYVLENYLQMLPMAYLFKENSGPSGFYNEIILNNVRKFILSELIREGQTPIFKPLITKKTYYYNFLEQVVQTYIKKMKAGEVVPTPHERFAIDVIGIKQSVWTEPRGIFFFKKIKKKDKYDMFMGDTQQYAEIILNSYIKEEYEKVSEQFAKKVVPVFPNMQTLLFGTAPEPWARPSFNYHWPFIQGNTAEGGPKDVASNIESAHYSDIDKFTPLALTGAKRYVLSTSSPPFFVLEKYIYVKPKTESGSEEVSTEVPQDIKELIQSNLNLIGVVNIEDMKNFINDNPELKSYSINDLWNSWSYGVRVVMVFQDSDVSSMAKQLKTSTTTMFSRHHKSYCLDTTAELPEVAVPMCSYDLEIENLSLDNTFPEYNLTCMLEGLIKEEDYKFAFDYIFPMKTYVSLIATYFSTFFVDSLRRKNNYITRMNSFYQNDGRFFENSKELMRGMFESLYYSKYAKTDSYDGNDSSITQTLENNFNPIKNIQGLNLSRSQKYRLAPQPGKLNIDSSATGVLYEGADFTATDDTESTFTLDDE